jgi:F5/8 type C domain
MRLPTTRRKLVRYLALGSVAVAVAGVLVATTTADASAGSLLSRRRPVTASSTENSTFAAANAVDGKNNTRWASAAGTDPQWISIDLGTTATISRVSVSWASAYARAYQIQVSDDQNSWRVLAQTAAGDGRTDTYNRLSGTGRYVRMYATVPATAAGAAAGAAQGYSLTEMRVYGRRAGSPTPTTTATGTPSAAASPSDGQGATSSPTATATATATASSSASASTGPCGRKAGTSPAVTVTDVNVGVAVTGYAQEADTDPLPMAIAARPDGGSWLAWLGTDSRVHLGRLDCDDHLVGTPTSFDGVDLQDVQADANGGVVLLTRKGAQGSGTLCGGTSSPAYTMWMVRFDTSGQQVWERQVTNLSDTLGGYDNGARFVWWYQHHGRLAFDGTNYAAYFGVAITVQNGNCVDIHEGDRMQVVNATTGALVSGHDSFEVGCSHSWTTRIVWDSRSGHFAMVCATDNSCRIAQPNPYRTVAAGTCDGTLFGGDLVLGSGSGYWTAWSQGGQARLEHFTTGASDSTIRTSAATSHPHLVAYGTGRMLLAWESGSSMAAQAYDAGTGTAVGSQFTVGVKDHSFQAFKAYADGSAASPGWRR